MAEYSVDVEALARLEQHMADYVRLVSDKLEEVESVIASISGAWDGTASEAYRRRHRDWLRALGEMREQVDDLREWSAQTRQTYKYVMDANVRMAGQ